MKHVILATDFLFDLGQLAQPTVCFSLLPPSSRCSSSFLECHRAKKPLTIAKSSETALKKAVGAEWKRTDSISDASA